MAEKKSWRDYSVHYGKDNTTSSKKTGSDSKKANDWRNYSKYGDGTALVGGTVTERVNNWLTNHNSYITSYQDRYSGRKYNYEDSYVSDSADWLNKISQQKSEYDAEADSILEYMEQHKRYLDEKWLNEIKNTITSARSTQSSILDNVTKDNEYWSSFGNEDLVKQYGSAEDAYKYYQRDDSYRQKYTGMTYDDIQKVFDTIGAGEETDWLVYNQHELYKSDPAYSGKASSGWKSFEAQKIAKQEEEDAKPWWQKAIESFANTPADTSLPNAGLINATVAYQNDKSYREPNDKWSEGQKLHFGYLWVEDKKKAYEYAEQLNNQIAAAEKAGKLQQIQDAASNSGWGMIGHTLGAIATAPLGLADLLDNMTEYAGRGTITEKGEVSPFEYSQAAQSGIANKLNSGGVLNEAIPIIGGKGWGDVYSLGVSAANSLVSAYTMGGTGTLINFIGQGGASGVDDALSRGATPEQALLYGAIVGAAEGVTEMLPADELIKVGSSSTLKNYFKTALKQGVGEFAEEGVSAIIGNVADNIIMQDKSQFNALVKEYMEKEDLSEEEAKKKAWTKLAEDAVFDAIGGFVTGSTNAMLVSGIKTGMNNNPNNQANVEALKQYGDQTDALIQEGLQSDVKSDSYKLAQKYQQQTQGKDGKQGKAMTGAQIRNLLAANQEQITSNDMKLIQQAAEKRLTDLGQTNDVSKVAELATKYATGQNLSKAEKNILASSEYGSRVANEMLPKNIASEDYSTGWAEEIGTKQVNAAAYNKKTIRTLLDAMASTEDPNAYKSLESRTDIEAPAKVSDSGKAVISGTDTEIDLTKARVKAIAKDGMVLEVDGKEVHTSEIDFATDEQYHLFNAVKNIEHITPTVASEIIAEVDMEKSIGDQLNGMDEAFTYGFYNYPEADLKAGLFTGNLTEEQLNNAYNLGRYVAKDSIAVDAENIKKMRTAADVQMTAEQQVAQQKAQFASDAEVYFEDGGTVVKFDEHNAGQYDDKRMAGVNAAKFLSKMGIGGKYYFYESYENADGVRVYKDASGNEVAAPNGIYKSSDGSIHIDMNAGDNGEGTTLFTLGHEATHFVKQHSKKQFKVLSDLVTETYSKSDMSMHDRVLEKQSRLSKIRGEDVSYDEAFEEVVADAMSTMFSDGNIYEKLAELKTKDKGLFDTIKKFFEQLIAKFKELYEELTPDQKDAQDIRQMKDMFDKLQTAFAEALVEASDNFRASEQIGVEIDANTESVSPAVMNSERTWTESEYVQQREKAAQEISKAIGVTEQKAKDYIDSVNSIAKMIAEDRSRLDYFSSPGRSSFVDNAEYGGSFDFSTLCKKRRLLTGTFTAIQKALPNTALTADEILDIRNRMKEANLDVSCGLCYVEGSRANMGQFAKEFLRLYKQYYPDAWQPNMADVNTPDGIEWVRINHPECYEQYEYFWNHYGTLKEGDKNLFASQQKPKLYQLHTEYKGEILQKFKGDEKVEEKNLNGGIRLQSFSDFEIVHLIDTMQIIMDMSRVGLAGQAYTKVPDFAWALGDTGLKINLSLIAKGVDADGKLIFDDVEGMPIADAMKLRDRYSKNVGTILVAFNDEQLLAALADDRVDFIIPFHRSQWKKSQYGAMGLPAKTKDYTFMQNEKFIKPTFHEYRGRMVKDKATNYMPNEYWDFSKSGKENAEAYLEMCARNNKRPKFYKLLTDNGDGSYSLKADGSTDGYWKLLIDFKMYDNDGNGSPQMAVKPEFNMEEANRMLNDYKGGHSNFPVAQVVVDSFVKDYKASHKGVKFSERSEFRGEIDKWSKEGKSNDETFILGSTGDVIQGLGAIESDIYMYGEKINTILDTHPEITLEEIKKIPQILENPILILESKNVGRSSANTRMVLFGSVKAKNGLPVTAILDLRPVENHLVINDMQKVTSAYTKDSNPVQFVQDSNVLYADKKRATSLLRSIGFQMPIELNKSGFLGNITYEGRKVKMSGVPFADIVGKTNGDGTKYSDRDSTGKQLTKEQQEYFKDSLVRDANGNLKVVYHGSGSEFTVFSHAFMSMHGSMEGQGFYFTDKKSMAEGYQKNGTKLMTGYLDIKKPLSDSKVTLKRTELTKLLKAIDPTGDDVVINYDPMGGVGYPSRVWYNRALAATVDAIYNSSDSDSEILADLANSGAGTETVVKTAREVLGYDGYIVSDKYDAATVYVAFESNQFKNADNLTPTSDPDIRYSERGAGTSNRHLLANAFEGITQNSNEYKLIQEYKGRIKLLNEYEEKLSNLNAEIRKITFGTEGVRDYQKLKQLQAEAKQVAEDINRNDKKLLSLEASEPLRKVIERERKKESQKTKAHVKEIQENKKYRAEQTELRHKIRKAIRDLDKILNRGNKKLNVKEDLQPVVTKALQAAEILFTDNYGSYDMLRNGIGTQLDDSEKALVAECAKMLSNIDKMTADSYEGVLSRQEAENRLRTKMGKLKSVFARERSRLNEATVSSVLGELEKAYGSLKDSKDSYVQGAYSEPVHNYLVYLQSEVGGATVQDMTTKQLELVYAAYKMVLTTVRDANKLFVKGKTESIEQMAGRIMGDFSKRMAPDGKMAIIARNIANKIGWDYEKLYYALDRIGSDAFAELVMNIANSENIVMQDIREAAAFRDEMVKKYDFNNWTINKEIDREFLDNTGKKFKLTLGQLMALYAYSRREGAWDHIEYGGFVFGEAALTNPRPADSYKLNKAQCEAITNLLTKEQKGYVEDMQKFLSETMGEKGNEVSMLMYGIKMFNEKNYFPIHIAGQFKAQANESQAKAAEGFQSMSNAGFTHAQNPNAKAPFVLEGFNEIWADHVNEMSRYHGTVPALEDMRKVMNRSFYSESGAESMAIKQMMENSYGKEAVKYFDNLYREANSGAITDKLEKDSKWLLSKFRKNSVAYSLSVLIQQPASIVRAYAMIDKKYFGYKGVGAISSGIAKSVSDKWTKAHTNAYNEMLKYAPGVTMAKEIGGFDTATGGSIRSYLLDTNKKFTQKWKTETATGKGKAVMDLVDNNAVANLPNVADKIAWIEIWNACKREAVAKHKDLAPNSEEFMQAVGERFTEVIRATQVYDSIFAKSPMLKSKRIYVQMLVSFMNEPNTVANMVEAAVRDVTKGNWKQGVRTGAVLLHSIIFTNVLKSIIYAMRDDDEDETYIEKYIEAVTGGMMDDLNALNYIPLLRDVVSVAQGYDVERTDMAIFADLFDAVEKVYKYSNTDTEDMTEEQLIELDKKQTEANWKLVESLAAFIGIPIKNIRREIDGVLDHARIAHTNAGQTTALSAWDKIQGAVVDSLPDFLASKESKTDKLYDAIVSGDKAYLARLKSTYKTDSAYQTAVRKALREGDSRIHDAAQAKINGNTEEYKRIFRAIKDEGKFSFDDIMSAINSEESKIRNGIEPDKVTSSYAASDFVEAIVLGDQSNAQAMRDDIIATHIANGKTEDEAEDAFASAVATGIRDAYYSGLLDKAKAEKMLMEYAGKGEDEAASKVSYWAFSEEHPEYDYFTEANVAKYHEFAEPENISVDVYAQFVNGTKGLKTKYDEWGDVVESERDQVLAVIDSLPLTWQQKDALYLAAGYKESKIWDVPW